MHSCYCVGAICVPDRLSETAAQRAVLMNGRFLDDPDDFHGTIELPPDRAVYFVGGQASLSRDISLCLDEITGIQNLGNCAVFGVVFSRSNRNLGHMKKNAGAKIRKAGFGVKSKVFRRSTPVIQQTAVPLKTYTIIEVFPWVNPTIRGADLGQARQIRVATPGTLTVNELMATLTQPINGQAFLPAFEGILEV